MELLCNYELGQLNKFLIGQRLTGIRFKKGTFSIDNKIFSGFGPFLLQFYNERDRLHTTFEIQPQGKESIGGNLFGFSTSKLELLHQLSYESLGFVGAILLDDTISNVTEIISVGEKSIDQIDDPVNFEFWFGPDKHPETVTIDKCTLDVIGIRLSDKTWLFVTSGGFNYYSVHFRSRLSPMEFVAEQGYPAMERKLVILEEVV